MLISLSLNNRDHRQFEIELAQRQRSDQSNGKSIYSSVIHHEEKESGKTRSWANG